MDPISSSWLAQIICDERVAEAEARGAYRWLPEDHGSSPLAGILRAIGAAIASLRPARASLDARRTAS
jgi:hypothetical protein